MIRSMSSWGRIFKADHEVYEPAFADELSTPFSKGKMCLAYGLGRSYGDACLNSSEVLIRTHRLDRVLKADWDKGIIRAEAGISLDALLRLVVSMGWFLPVVPDTKFVTLGGAVANDVHGKNHKVAGTFGSHVRCLSLLRSSGEIVKINSTNHEPMFAATIGGLGLTGLIQWIEFQLTPLHSAYLETETLRLRNIDEFFDHEKASDRWDHTAAWIDCFAPRARLGEGVFIRARPASSGQLTLHRAPKWKVPFDVPAELLTGPVMSVFNRLYRTWLVMKPQRYVHYDSFLFPLDGVADWNRLYGSGGLYQQQSVVPFNTAPQVLRCLLNLISKGSQRPFLMVLKVFGPRSSPGILSFPMEGVTVALDFPNRGSSTREFLDRLAGVVVDAGGRFYPAKDATMSPEAFQAGYPRWREVERFRDPKIMSDFWRRVTRAAA